jgi:tight adherence protein C
VNRTFLLIGFLVFVLTLCAIAAVLSYHLQRQSRLAARMMAVRNPDSISQALGPASSSGITRIVTIIGTTIVHNGLLSRKTKAGLERTLAATGFRGAGALEVFVGTKLLLFLVMPLLAYIALGHTGWSPLVCNGGVSMAALVGLLGPDWWLGRSHKKYLRAITLGLPDALDLMVICAEAGLGFEPAINRVAVEIRIAHPAISTEFGLTASELRVAADGMAALNNMGVRTGLESVKRITSILVQTMRYGTPLGDALRVLSAEMRQEMLIRFETRAARLPVLLTVPMILFILPCIFLIVGGPAVVQVMQSPHP